MPKLLVFVPCEKVLIDEGNNISLISLLQELWLPAVDIIPANFKAGIRWDVVTLWAKTPEDEGRIFEQDIMLLAPDGAMTSHTKLQFSMSTRFHRTVSKMYGFPVSQPGEYSLVLKLKDMQNESVFILETRFPLFVGHQAKPESPAP